MHMQHGLMVTKAALVLGLLATGGAGAQETSLDATAKKFIGAFQYKIELLVATCTISHEDGKWAVSGVFKEKGRNIGAFEGTDVEYQSGTLTFKQTYLVKPRPNWTDNEKITIKLAGGIVVAVAERKGAPLYTLERISDPSTANPPAKTQEQRDDLKKVVGYWSGDTRDGHKAFIHIDYANDNWKVQLNYYTKKGMLFGSGMGTDFKIEDGKLTYRVKYMKRPQGWPESPVQRVESIVENTLTLSRRDGKRWQTVNTYVRAKK
jgi:hypothetical protein